MCMTSTPSVGPAARSLKAVKHQQALAAWLDTQPGLVAEMARTELTDIIRLTTEINALESVLATVPTRLLLGCSNSTAVRS